MILKVELLWFGFCLGCPAELEDSSGAHCFYDYYNEAGGRVPERRIPPDGTDPNKVTFGKWKWDEIVRPQKCIEERGE